MGVDRGRPGAARAACSLLFSRGPVARMSVNRRHGHGSPFHEGNAPPNVLMFEQMQSGNEWMAANRLETPIARGLRKLSFDHWVVGSILGVLVLWVVLFVLFDLLTWGRSQGGLLTIVAVGFVISMPWFILFNRCRVQDGRSEIWESAR